MNTVRVAIVDDEPPARRGIKKELKRFSEANIVGEASNGEEAIELIRQKEPDLVFLDIHMPLLNGLELINQVDSDRFPLIVFVTAFDKFALEAFEVHAVDYLLKPIDPVRFEEAYKRAKERLRLGKIDENSAEIGSLINYLEGRVTSAKDSGSRMIIQDAGKVSFLDYDEIVWVESSGNYLNIHLKEDLKPLLIRETLQSMEERLESPSFVRIHRSKIVNLDNVKEMERQPDGRYVLNLRNGEELTSSRRYKDRIEELLTELK